MVWLRKKNSNDRIRVDDQNELRQAIEQGRRITVGPGLTLYNTGAGIHIGLTQQPYRSDVFCAKVRMISAIDGQRWTYHFDEMEKTSPGYGGWSVKANGRNGTAYNTIEDLNAGANTYGNGVQQGNIPNGFEMKEATTSVRVLMKEITLPDGTIEYWFQYENGIDGQCL